MRKAVLASIVEGHGEKPAVPIILGRLASLFRADDVIIVTPPAQRIHREQMRKQDVLASYLNVAAEQTRHGGAIFLFLDADDDQVCEIGPEILALCHRIRPDREIIVCVSQREFEAIFIAAAESLGIETDQPFDVRDAKGEIRRALGAYAPTVDQPVLARAMSLEEAMVVPHFSRLCHKIQGVVA